MDIILKRSTEFTIDSCHLDLLSTLDHDGFIIIKNFWDMNQLSYIQNHNISGCRLDQIVEPQNTFSFLREDQLNLFKDIPNNILDLTDLPAEKAGLYSFNSKSNSWMSEQALLYSFLCLTNFTSLDNTCIKLVTGSHKWEDVGYLQNSYHLAIEAHILAPDIALMSKNILYEVSYM